MQVNKRKKRKKKEKRKKKTKVTIELFTWWQRCRWRSASEGVQGRTRVSLKSRQQHSHQTKVNFCLLPFSTVAVAIEMICAGDSDELTLSTGHETERK